MPTPDVDFLSSRIYDTLLWLLSILIDLFFREVRTRGSFRVPRYDPVIFVAAPHSNQVFFHESQQLHSDLLITL